MRIRKLARWNHPDFECIQRLDSECFLKTDAPLLNGPNYHWWVVLNAVGRIVAYAGLHEEEDGVRFCRAGVYLGFRGFGLQRRLIACRLRWARKNGFKRARTYTDHKNLHSQRNLVQCGFQRRRLAEYDSYTIDITK